MLTSQRAVPASPVPFRIFVSSPGDVKAERAACHRVVERLRHTELGGFFSFYAFAYDKAGVDVLFRYGETPELSVDRMLTPSDCDLVVVILWNRLGTPLPGIHRKPDGSLYRSGTEYELQDALQGREHSGRPEITVYRQPKLPNTPPVTDPAHNEVCRQQQAVVDFFKRVIESNTGAMRHGFNEYEDPTDFETQFREHLQRLLEERRNALSAVVRDAVAAGARERKIKHPYPGLRTFYRQDGPIFFGRDREIDRLIDSLRRPGGRFLAVVGSSGSGKSSLVRAGVLPRLEAGGPIEGCENWCYPEPFKPSDQEGNPFLALANAIKPFLAPHFGAGDVATRLRAEPTNVSVLLEEAMEAPPSGAEMLLVVDQFEELFTVIADGPTREGFMALLAAAVAVSPSVEQALPVRASNKQATSNKGQVLFSSIPFLSHSFGSR